MKSPKLSTLLLVVLLGAGAGAALDAVLNLGDRFKGNISTAGDVDVIEFDALAGTVITISVKRDKKQDLLPRLEVLDLSTVPPTSLANEASGMKKTVVKQLTVPSTGAYRVCISGDGNTTGSYTVKTRGKLTKAVKKQTVIEETVPADASFSLQFDASPAMTLNARFSKRKSDAAAGNPRLEGPGEAPIPLTGFFTQKKDKIIIKNFVLEDMGTYTLSVDNVGETGDMKGKTSLKPPKIPKETVTELVDP